MADWVVIWFEKTDVLVYKHRRIYNMHVCNTGLARNISESMKTFGRFVSQKTEKAQTMATFSITKHFNHLWIETGRNGITSFNLSDYKSYTLCCSPPYLVYTLNEARKYSLKYSNLKHPSHPFGFSFPKTNNFNNNWVAAVSGCFMATFIYFSKLKDGKKRKHK